MKSPILSHAMVLTLSLHALSVVYAGSATWNPHPTSNDWNTSTNWTPQTVPNDPAAIASFTISSKKVVSISANTIVDSIIFAAGASAFTINAKAVPLTIDGVGVTNSSAIGQNFTTSTSQGNAGLIRFTGTSIVSGLVTFTNQFGFQVSGITEFDDSASAGSGTFFNQAVPADGSGTGGMTVFHNTATAGAATVTNVGNGGPVPSFYSGSTYLYDNSSADHATFINETRGGTSISDSATAGDATFINNDNGGTGLSGVGVTGGNATFINNGGTTSGGLGGGTGILNGADAGNATLIANGGTNAGEGGHISFSFNATGGTATVKLYGNGMLSTALLGGPSVTIGSLEGDGVVVLGTNTLAIGSNDRDTTFSGLITESGSGKIQKVGSGTLILNGRPNRFNPAYHGGTTVSSGTLLVDNHATGSGLIQVNAGTLGGIGKIGPLTIGSGDGPGAFLAPGIDGVAELLSQDRLTFNADGIYNCEVDTDTMAADETGGRRVTINSGAQFVLISQGTSALPAGTVFTVIDNRGHPPISGAFANLPDGGTVTVNGNTFQANYEGGDGNDLTLTVVP
jgi:autotransporter-associated beta strand protein